MTAMGARDHGVTRIREQGPRMVLTHRVLIVAGPAGVECHLDHRIAAAEGAIHRRRNLAAAARQHHVAEALTVSPGHPPVLLEPVVRVVVDQL